MMQPKFDLNDGLSPEEVEALVKTLGPDLDVELENVRKLAVAIAKATWVLADVYRCGMAAKLMALTLAQASYCKCYLHGEERHRAARKMILDVYDTIVMGVERNDRAGAGAVGDRAGTGAAAAGVPQAGDGDAAARVPGHPAGRGDA
jgi:hypothetical protein